MTKRIIRRILHEFSLLLYLINNYKRSKDLSRLSVLSEKNYREYSAKTCPICKNNNLRLFAKFPINIPAEQNHSLLYFDYVKNDIGLLKSRRELLDKTLGFFVSLTWNFCETCGNGSLASEFSSDHMLEYYMNYYKRGKITDQFRRNTKELHGKYLTSLLPPNSSILEVGSADGITAEYLAGQGHNVYAYEPSMQFSEQLKQSDLITYIDDYAALDGEIDAIYLHHVLEHIPDPIKYIKKLMPLLKSDGLLLIQVPDLSLQLDILSRVCKRGIYILLNRAYFNLEVIKNKTPKRKSSDWFDVLANDHINAFTVEGLKYVLTASGFQMKTAIQSTEDRITYNKSKYAWPVDEETGNTPNGLTVIARKTWVKS